MKRIFVNIVDGLVDVHDIPAGVEVVVRDYDVEGSDGSGVTMDEDGMPYYETVWGNDES
jgi:hypothetical protein